MSKNYEVEVQETYQRVFHKVNAESDDEALKKVSDEFVKGHILLDWSDFVGREYHILNENSEIIKTLK